MGEYTHYIDGTFIGVKLAEINRGNDDGPEGYGAADMHSPLLINLAPMLPAATALCNDQSSIETVEVQPDRVS